MGPLVAVRARKPIFLVNSAFKATRPAVLLAESRPLLPGNPALSPLLISEASIHMPKITFVEHSGKTHQVEAGVGENLMQVALNNQIASILGDCGGNCACATCHVYVDAPWTDKVNPAETTEKEMIDCTVYSEATSRLGCQVIVTADHEGLVVRLPESQV